MPAQGLNQNSAGIAAGYGIGAGLSSFVDAYQNALNYQLLKAQAAATRDYQQTMAEAAMKHVGNESAELPIKRSEAIVKLGELGGTPVIDYYGNELKSPEVIEAEKNQQSASMGNNVPIGAPQNPQIAPAPIPGASEQGPGFVGPPRPAGLLPPASGHTRFRTLLVWFPAGVERRKRCEAR